MKLTVYSNEPAIHLNSLDDIDSFIKSAGKEANSEGIINVISFEAANGNSISMAVGTRETVLNFVFQHNNPPYYASKGNSDDTFPVMTTYLMKEQHTEYPRKHVISIEEGIKAIHEFFEFSDLPKCIKWVEV